MNPYEALAHVYRNDMHAAGDDQEHVICDILNEADTIFGEYASKDKTAFLLACDVPKERITS